MPIATMTDLAAVPVGSSVYYGERKYTRIDDKWWSTETSPDSPVIRSRYFVGAVNAGMVVTEGERPIKPGATAVADNFWYYVKAEKNVGGYYPCIRIVSPKGAAAGHGTVGQVNNWNREVNMGWLREHLEPLPPEAEQYLKDALLGEITRLNTALDAKKAEWEELRAADQKRQAETRTEREQMQRLRSVMQEIIA